MRLYKCYGHCNEKYPLNEMVKISNKNYCKSCAEKIEKEKNDRQILYKTIQQIFNIPYPSGQMLKQIKQFKEERNYTYEGMTKTLHYFVKILNKIPYKNAGLSFLPYHYDSAIQYYNDLEERRKNMKSMIIERKKIQISPLNHKIPGFIEKKKYIDMGGLILDDNDE